MVNIPTFTIGVYPITNRDYAAFLADTRITHPCYWDDARLNQPDQPVVGVTWNAAQAYCSWLTNRMQAAGQIAPSQVVRLPTEPEWEKAAGWNPVLQRAQRYPWGDHVGCRARRHSRHRHGAPPPRHTESRGRQRLRRLWHARQCGEWTASLYASYAGASTPFARPNHYAIRGGSCALQPTHLRCSYRCHLPSHSWRYHLGFRVVAAAPLRYSGATVARPTPPVATLSPGEGLYTILPQKPPSPASVDTMSTSSDDGHQGDWEKAIVPARAPEPPPAGYICASL